MNIIVVEDRNDIANLVRINLEMLNFEVSLCANLAQARKLLEHQPCDLLILDLGLPDGDGVEFCRQLRSQQRHIPILMLTARTSELERVEGLESGADDYLTKPFSILELQARAKALLRRGALNRPQAQQATRLQFDGLHIDTERREVLKENNTRWNPITLTSTEFDLLLHLAQHPGKVFNRAQLLSDIWGYQHEGYEHTVNSHINRLRNKIEDNAAEPRYVKTVWGVGYKFMSEGL